MKSPVFQEVQKLCALESKYITRLQNMWIEKSASGEDRKGYRAFVYVQLLKLKDCTSLELLISE